MEKHWFIILLERKIKKLIINDDVETISHQCFFGTLALESVHIGKGLKTLVANPWVYCTNLKTITIDKENKYFEVVDDVLFTKGRTKLITYSNGKDSSIYFIPLTITTIIGYAFRGNNHLEIIILPSTVTRIDTFSFIELNKLKYILYGGNKEFSNCGDHSLQNFEIRVPTDYPINSTFCGRSISKTLTVSKNSLGQNVGFIYDTSDTTLYIYGEGETNNYGYGTSTVYTYRSTITSVYISDAINKLGNFLFLEFKKITSISIPNSMISLGGHLFRDCSSLQTVSFGKNLQTFSSDNAFISSPIKTFLIHPENPYIKFENNILYTINDMGLRSFAIGNTEIKEYTIPSYIKRIYSFAFRSSSLISLTIHKNVETIGNNPLVFSESFQTVRVDKDNLHFTVNKDGILFTKDMKTLILCPSLFPQSSYSIPFGVEVIGVDAFSGSLNIQSIVITNSVTTLKDATFRFMEKLTKVIISGSVKSFGGEMFNGAYKVTSLIYDGTSEPSSCSIGMFHASSITTVKVPTTYTGSTTSFCGKSLTVSKELEVGTLGNQINYILEIDGTLTVYGNGTMNNYWWNSPVDHNTKIKSVEIHEGITHIGNAIFLQSTSITTISIPLSITSMGNNPFCQCTSLSSITLNDNDNFIFENDCLYDKNKTRIIICLATNKRTTFTIPQTVKTIDSYAFYGNNLESIIIHDNMEELKAYAFDDLQNMKSVSIGKNLKTMGYNPFMSSPLLTTITIDQDNKYFKFENGILTNYGKTQIITYLISNTNVNYTIPNGITHIKYRSFQSNQHIQSITIPSTVTMIEYSAFEGCSNLQIITFKGTKQPTCGDIPFNKVSSSLVINVPYNYNGETFCGKQVTKST